MIARQQCCVHHAIARLIGKKIAGRCGEIRKAEAEVQVEQRSNPSRLNLDLALQETGGVLNHLLEQSGRQPCQFKGSKGFVDLFCRVFGCHGDADAAGFIRDGRWPDCRRVDSMRQ